MAMARTWEQLRGLSNADLIKEYDQLASNTGVGINYYRDEITQREQRRSTRTIKRLTWVLTALTSVILVLTGVLLWVSIAAL